MVPRIPGADALILQNPDDERTFFAIPWDDATLIGTTDTRYDGDPAGVHVEPEDIDYLLSAASYYLPGASLQASDVIYSFAGLRPLIAPSRDGLTEGQISRSHRVVTKPAGVVTLVGGKFTTFRQMAQDATDALIETLGLPKRPCLTRDEPYFHEASPANDPSINSDLWTALRGRYGPRAGEVYDVCLSEPELSQPLIEGYDLHLGELVYSAREEKVCCLDDLIYRRTRLAWRPELSGPLRERIRQVLERHADLASLT